MPRIIRSRISVSDQGEIWRHIAKDSLLEADRFIQRIDRRLDKLSEFPLMGMARPGLGTDIYSFPVGKVVIFYVPMEDGIQIARILQGFRDINSDWF